MYVFTQSTGLLASAAAAVPVTSAAPRAAQRLARRASAPDVERLGFESIEVQVQTAIGRQLERGRSRLEYVSRTGVRPGAVDDDALIHGLGAEVDRAHLQAA